MTRFRKRHLAKLRAAQKTSDISTNYREVHRFTDPTQVHGGGGWGGGRFNQLPTTGDQGMYSFHRSTGAYGMQPEPYTWTVPELGEGGGGAHVCHMGVL